MKQRIITAVVLLAVLALVVWQIDTPLFIFVIAFLSAVASNEIMKCAKIKNKFILTLGTAVAAIIPFTSSDSVMEPWISSADYSRIVLSIPPLPVLTVIVIAYFIAMLKDYANTRFEHVGIAVVASIVVPYAFSTFGILRDMFGFAGQYGIYFIFYGLICALGTDSGAQLGGIAFGKHKMSPNISPKKTVEGAVCGVIFCFVLNLVAILFYNKFADDAMKIYECAIMLILSPIASLLGMMGDLSASVLKRNYGIKDFGKIFPGHGGVMDRFDSSLFTVPFTYCIAVIIKSVSYSIV